jgi:redox-sensitive bicupin YhaK (pirin superfamily)
MRSITKIITNKLVLEGAGVKLKRVFGYSEIPEFDPFLLLDHFGSENPDDYIRGFPWHPHRGIETVTYMLSGKVEHGDSLGNKGVISSGEIQWMSAGSGIIHQEMPKRYVGLMQGFQLWVNLPQKDKMTSPRYMGIEKDEVVQISKEGAKIKIVAGQINGSVGPVKDLFVEVEYFDVELSGEFLHNTEKKTAFIYVYMGMLNIGDQEVKENQCAILDEAGGIKIEAKNARFLFIAGDPLNEPIAWGGPIVMNTKEELDKAFEELHEGTFIKDAVPDNVEEDFYQK